MSGLTGYLTSNGVDLSNIFLSNGGGTFTGTITTNGGINGPSSSISYIAGMIGYTVTVPGTKTSASITSGTIVSLITGGFTMPIGVYLVFAYASNTYTSSGSLSFINVGISISDTSVSSGFNMTAIGSATLPTNGYIKGGVTNLIQNTSATVYYLIENVTFSTVTVSTDTPANSYVRYTRIA